MFNKKLTLVLITLVFMLSISVVSATDNNSTDDMSAGEVEEEPPSGTIKNITTEDVATTLDNGDEYFLNGSDIDMYYNDGSDFVLTLYRENAPVYNASIIVNINGVDYNQITDVNGKVSIPLNLNTGSYVVSSYYGNVTSLKTNINVLPIIIGNDLVKTYKSSTKYYATFLKSDGTPLDNYDVKFRINGITYTKKTNSNGVASIDINLKVGRYTIYAIHPNGYEISNSIVVRHSIETANIDKHYKSSKKFTATFYGTNGKVLANKKIKFKYAGKTYTKKTNKKGIASLTISSKPGNYKIISINPVTDESVKNTIKVSKTIYADNLVVYSGTTSSFKVKLYKNDKLVKNAKVYVYINGHRKTAKTNSDGIAGVNFKLSKGTYIFKSIDPYTKYAIKSKVQVKFTSIKASNVFAKENTAGEFKAILYKQNGKLAKNTKMQIIIDGVKHTVKTNSNGVATYKFSLPEGSHSVTCKDLSSGFTLDKKIVVLNISESKLYNKYGVSEDGKTILAIGRPSASGELSKYGYNFYQTEFLRICPYCGSEELYWGIFWADSESSDTGIFPATGKKEGGSAEGHIFCAHCDCDWSIFGHNHGGCGGDLTVVISPIQVSKETVYLLKSGTYVYP